jgi:hypothetical protein
LGIQYGKSTNNVKDNIMAEQSAPIFNSDFMKNRIGTPSDRFSLVGTGNPNVPGRGASFLDIPTSRADNFDVRSGVDTDLGFPESNPDLQFNAPEALPDVQGRWVDKGKFGLGVAEFGLGVYNALEARKMNKFMRGYYGDQMAMQRTDFANAARSANQALSSREERLASARGLTGTDREAAVQSSMDKWGVDEDF